MSLPPYDQSIRDFERQFQVVLPDAVGQATVGFREGVWYRLNSGAPHPVPIRSAIIMCPHAAGSIVQIACWWMRENARSPRALDLATELALTVGELARKAIEDDPLGMSLNSLSSSGASLPSSAPSAPLGSSGSFAGAGVGSLGSSGGYDSGSYSSGSYNTDPYASAAQPAPSYEPAYAAAPPAAAATTLLPQITPEMTNPPGRSLGGVPRQSGPQPGLSPLPPSGGRPGAAGPGFGGPRGPMPGGRPPMGAGGQAQSGSWDRPAMPDPRTGRPAGGPPPRPGAYDGSEPRDDFFRSAPPQQRRPEEYGGGRAPSRPVRPDPSRSW